jgi:uncharacterized protein YraI
MKRSVYFFLVMMLALGTSLSSCTLPVKLPLCDPAVVSISAIFPSYSQPVLDLAAYTIEWRYYTEADGSDPLCDPESQHIRMGHRSWDEGGYVVKDVLAESDLDDSSRTFTPGVALDPGGHYYYEVTWYGEAGKTNSRTIPFNTGPICSRAELLPPLILSVPDGAVVAGDVTLSWMFQGGCTPESVDARISTNRSFSPDSTLVYSYDRAFHGLTGFEACEEYYWKVASVMTVPPTDIYYVPDMDFRGPFAGETLEYEFTGTIHSDFTSVRSFYVIGDACPVAPIDFGPILRDDLRVPPRVRLLMDANCRSGPTKEYPVLSVLPPESEYDIQGVNRAGDSWLILNPQIETPCWVYDEWVEVVGDVSLVEVIDPDPPTIDIPTETPVPVNCAQYNTNPAACNADPACKYFPNNPPSNRCVNQ